MKKVKIILILILTISFFNFFCVQAEEITNINLTVKDSTYNSIKITWNKYTGAKTYKIYRSTSLNGKYTKIGTTTKTSYINLYLTYGKTYYYYIKVYNSKGKKIYTSEKISGILYPDKVTKLTISNVTKNSIKITGKNVNATGYKIYRSTDGINYTKVGTTSYMNFTDKKLSSNTLYYYKTRAYKTVNGKKYMDHIVV